MPPQQTDDLESKLRGLAAAPLTASVTAAPSAHDDPGGLWNNIRNGLTLPMEALKGLPNLAGAALSTLKGAAQVPGTLATAGVLNLPSTTNGDQFLNDVANSPLGFAVNTDTIRAAARDQPIADAITGGFETQAPLLAGVSQGVAQTGINIADTGLTAASELPQSPIGALLPSPALAAMNAVERQRGYQQDWADSLYGKSAAEGQAGVQLINDVANVAAAGEGLSGATSGASGLGGLSRAATAGDAEAAANLASRDVLQRSIAPALAPYAEPLQQAAEMAGSSANIGQKITTPLVAPWAAPAKIGQFFSEGKTLADTRLGQAAPESLSSPVSGFVDKWLGQPLKGLRTRAETRDTVTSALHEQAPEIRGFRSDAGAALQGLSPEEARAGILASSGMVRPDNIEAIKDAIQAPDPNAVMQGPPPPEVMQQRLTDLGLHGVTPQVLNVLDQSFQDPALAARIANSPEGLKGFQDWREENRFKQAVGSVLRSPDDLEAKQEAARVVSESDGVMHDFINRDMENPGEAYRQGRIDEGTYNAIKSAKTAEDSGAWEDIRQQLASKPEYATPEYRSVIKFAQQSKDHFSSVADDMEKLGNDELATRLRSAAEEVPATVADLQAMGVRPEGHLIGGPLKGGKPGGDRPTSLGQKKLSSDYVRGSGQLNASPEAQFNAMVRRTKDEIHNIAVAKLVDDFGHRAGTPGFDNAEGMKYIDEQGRGVADPAKAAAAVPKAVYKGLNDLRNARDEMGFSGGLARAADASMKPWKALRLVFSPQWYYDQVLSIAAIGSISGEMSPVEMIANAAKARREMLNPDANLSRIMDRGMADAMFGESGMVGADSAMAGEMGSKPIGPLAKVTKFGYKLNNTVDNFGKALTYVAKNEDAARVESWAKDAVKRGEITPREFDQYMAKVPSPEQAAKLALKAFGDMQNLTVGERNIIKRIFPFYPFYKYMTKLVFSLPADNPYRTAWTVQLGSMFQPNDNRPDYLNDAWRGQGDNFLQVTVGNPYTLGTPESSPLLNPARSLASMHPALKLAAAATGFNANTAQLMSYAPGSGPRDEFGRAALGFPGLSAVGYQALQQAPLGKNVADALVPWAKYDSGQVKATRNGKTPLSTKDIGPFPGTVTRSVLGLSAQEPNIAAINQSRKQRQQADDKARHQYLRDVRK